MSATPFSNIGRCIYCGSTDGLTREHVIPRGLGGNYAPVGEHEAIVLQGASCEACRKITQKFEEECQQKMMAHFRTALGLRSKESQSALTKITVGLPDGRTEPREINTADVPAVFSIPSFTRAGILQGLEIQQSYSVRIVSVYPAAKPAFLKLGENLQLTGRADVFAQMLAKIALGYAVSQLGPDGFVPIVQDLIRFGPTKGWGHYVGGDAECDTSEPPDPTCTHQLSTKNIDGKFGPFLLVYIRLFANFGGPRNYVVVGRPN